MLTGFTVDELADRWRRDPSTIYRWVRAGDLPACKLGREWVIDGHAVEAVEAGEVTGALRDVDWARLLSARRMAAGLRQRAAERERRDREKIAEMDRAEQIRREQKEKKS